MGLKDFFRGMGSILDIWPNTDYSEFIDKRTPWEIYCDSWQEVNDAFNSVLSGTNTEINQDKK